MRCCNFAEDLHGLLDRSICRDADTHFEAAGFALQGVIHNRALKDDAIRNEDFNAVVAVKLAAACADGGDGAGEGADFNKIADANRAFKEQDQATDEVVGELLGTETNRDGGRATEQGKNSQGDLNGGERHEADKKEKRVVGEFLDNRARGGVKIQAPRDARAEPAAEGGGNHTAHKQDGEGCDQHSQRDGAGTLDELPIHINRIAEGKEGSFPNLNHASAKGVDREVKKGGAGGTRGGFGRAEGCR